MSDPPKTAQELLTEARLYVLLDGRDSDASFDAIVRQLVLAGADVIQLRDKALDDRTLLARSRTLVRLTRGTDTLAIINDRPDVALLAGDTTDELAVPITGGADGVHVGQEELPALAARRLIGPISLLGISTHNLQQAEQAVDETADYIGVGPTFPSSTKQFAEFPSLAFVREVAEAIPVPAFAIGGITLDNVQQVRDAGLHRVAVGAAIVASDDPAAAVKEFKERLQ